MAMNGTMNEVALEMLWMPPSTTTAVRTVSAAPVIQGSTWKLAWMAWATELACTELPMPKEASTPNRANSTASHLMPRPRSM